MWYFLKINIIVETQFAFLKLLYEKTLQLSIFDAENQPRILKNRTFFSVRNPDNIFSFATFHTVTRKRKRKPGKVLK